MKYTTIYYISKIALAYVLKTVYNISLWRFLWVQVVVMDQPAKPQTFLDPCGFWNLDGTRRNTMRYHQATNFSQSHTCKHTILVKCDV